MIVVEITRDVKFLGVVVGDDERGRGGVKLCFYFWKMSFAILTFTDR